MSTSSRFNLKEFGALNTVNLTQPWSHWFFYGASGSGKTEAAASFPRPIFIVPHNEQSVVTLRGKNYPYFEVVDMDHTKFDPKTGRGSMMHIIKHLEAMYNKYLEDFPFDTVVCEATSHYCDLVQEQITNGSTKIMAQNDWGTLSSHMRTVQTRLRRLQMHSVFTALDITDADNDGKPIGGGPMLPGKLSEKLPSSCDVTGYCEVINGKDGPVHRIHFRKYKHFDARSRFRRLPALVTDFKFNKIQHVLEPDSYEQQ